MSYKLYITTALEEIQFNYLKRKILISGHGFCSTEDEEYIKELIRNNVNKYPEVISRLKGFNRKSKIENLLKKYE